ncbi:asparagine synthase (glutamine-hydrolyzing) [Actinoplanes awajinensis]|uniref:asparagine synthase (glutamine-hydrolyzing) n=1 Tax=Actinoplanes awajinensis subsp. mycoplanecinus TaxID=135947 RepID=A0A0X3VA34_9ACTN|nr:asparagine synthase (glutamine-hydrolyzing) [Actinoplanes awajinensis]KUL41645.1 asparagine synthase [Actinoplanes awajinensis subsp. mycoplanecinus]
MCGIVGWVSYRRDLRHEGAVLRAMAATMSLRGPDAEGIWLDQHAGLGHRRLAVIDLETGAQPMTVEHDRATIAAVTYSGEIYNYRELRTELRGLGHHFRTASDTEVLLRAYLQWGSSFVERLNGMYAFGLWDPRDQVLLLARDRMGIKPLFYRPTADGVVFASEPKGVLAHPQVPAVVDSDGLRELLGMVKTPGHGVYRDLREVRPGELVRIDHSGVRAVRYWTLTAREHTDDQATTVRTVRELLDDIVERQLIADVPLGVLLSGGLDSSAITALAAKALGASGAGPVRSFAVDFVGQTENFRSDEMRDTPDTPFVHEVASHVGADHTDIVLDSPALMDPLYRSAVLTASDLPSALGDMYTSLYLLFRAVRERSTVALSGESADEVFGGYRWFHDPAVIAADTFPWVAAIRALAPGPELQLFTPDITDKLDLAGYQDAAYRQALTEVEHLPGESPQEYRMREVSYLHLTRFVQILLDRKDRMSMAHGLEVRVPFCDHRLVEYVYNAPWQLKTFDGREKSLLRAATADVLPASVVARRKSPYPSTQDPAYEQMLRTQTRAVLTDPGSPLRPLIDVRAARRLMDGGYEGSSFGIARRGMEMLLSLDEWLTRYPVSLQLD